jgi:hypothetical protein
VQYRSGLGVEDEYLLLETLGWADHGHMDLGTIVQYCLGGHLWIVDGGYTNIETRHHSTLEVSRDGKPAWGHFPGERGRWGDFRDGPQLFEIIEQSPRAPGIPGPFSVKCLARNLAGATWVRAVSGGGGQGLVIEDTLTAEEPGEYRAIFRLRLLGEVTGEGGRWSAAQKGARLPVALEPAAGDRVGLAPWEPDGHTGNQGRYPFLPTNNDGHPATIEWMRSVRLERGQTTIFRACLGPLEKKEE